MLWEEWWLWMAVGVALAILEITVPGYVFSGFAVGACAVGLLMLVGISLGGLYMSLLIFAVISGVAWFGLRRYLGTQRGQTKTFDHDIND